jgi:hypothetical protein
LKEVACHHPKKTMARNISRAMSVLLMVDAGAMATEGIE